MATKKYLTLAGLTEYDELIKGEIAEAVADGVKDKASASHTHDDRYYTESEIDTKIAGVNTSISNHTGNADIHVTSDNKTQWNAAYTHSTSTHAPSNAERNIVVGIQKNGTDLTVNSSTRKVNITVPTTAAEIGAAASDHNHDSKYDAKGAAAAAQTAAEAYADSAAAQVKNDLVNGAGTAYDTLLELGNLIDDNKDAIDALEEVAAGKANATHSHAIADVTGLQSALDGKAASSHGTHVTYDSTNKPKMDGTAAFGTSSSVARADHVHPTDTSRASKAEFDAHVATHAPSNAQANVIESIKVNGTALTPTSKAVNITVPTNNNQLTNGAGYLVASDITGKADKSDTYTKSEVDSKTAVDSALSSTSTKPVQNKIINSAIVTATNAISANTSSINGHTTRISALETKVGDGFEEITSQEIQNLFA